MSPIKWSIKSLCSAPSQLPCCTNRRYFPYPQESSFVLGCFSGDGSYSEAFASVLESSLVPSGTRLCKAVSILFGRPVALPLLVKCSIYHTKIRTHSLYNKDYKGTIQRKGALVSMKVQVITWHKNTNCHFTTVRVVLCRILV